ncbi:hypothetical protein N305_00690, partial [Manacus vitellinus]
AGSLGIDLEVAATVTLLDSNPVRIPTTLFGPLSVEHTVGALLIGRSSSGANGLIVLPGVIDMDYEGQIQVIAYTLCLPCTVEKGTRIAQLVLLGKHPATPQAVTQARGTKGFGSTGGHFVNLVQKMHQRPMISVVLNHRGERKPVQMMCDTGADVTIIA